MPVHTRRILLPGLARLRWCLVHHLQTVRGRVGGPWRPTPEATDSSTNDDARARPWYADANLAALRDKAHQAYYKKVPDLAELCMSSPNEVVGWCRLKR